jgi:hypothetical protein
LLKESSAVVLFPGGFGTMDETFEVLTLLQTGKQVPIPVVMVETPETGYFRHLAEFIDVQMVGNQLITANDKSLFHVAESVEAACSEVIRFYHIYHSSRYVGEQLMIRLRRDLTKNEIEQLNTDFADILRTGRIEPAPMLPEEKDDAQLGSLSRIKLHFNRRQFGRLRQLIDALNALG